MADPKPPRVVVHNRIRALRFAHEEMTQAALGRAVGVSRQTINAIEGGKYAPSLEVAFRMARVFGTSLDAVFQCEFEGDGSASLS